MTYLAASAGALVVDRNTWHTRADTAYGVSRVWSSGSSFETDLGTMTSDRNYWKTTVAHDDPDVWTNRYNAGVSAANAALPAAYQLAAAVNSNSYTTAETTLRTITVNRTGYWWAACSVINADGGTVTMDGSWTSGGLVTATNAGTVNLVFTDARNGTITLPDGRQVAIDRFAF